MSWIFDGSGVAARVPFEAGWWPLFVAFGRVSLAAVAGSYLVVTANFLRAYGWRKDARPLSKLFRHVSLLLAFCALAQAGGALASGLSGQHLLMTSSVLAAVVASAAALKLPRLEQPSGAVAPASRALAPAPASSGDLDDLAAAHLDGLEDAARRRAWLLQKREAVRELDDLLSMPVTGSDPVPVPFVPPWPPGLALHSITAAVNGVHSARH